MQIATIQRNFESWRTAARRLLVARVSPDAVVWSDAESDQPLLAGLADGPAPADARGDAPAAAVPPRFLQLAEAVACHRDEHRWALLYRVLWRIAIGGERHLLSVAVDDDVHRLLERERRVRIDRHKMTAFVRFREVRAADDGLHYVAWYRPDHFIVRRTAPFFAKRFATMRWSILTPDECAHWHDGALTFTPGVSSAAAPAADDLEDLWRTYYANIFNPARVRPDAMKKEMPVRFWDILPEAQAIPDLIRDAPRRVRLMVANQPADHAGAAVHFPAATPDGPRTIDALRAAACACRGCPLHGSATQTVFGEGPPTAAAMLVGEQPGDQEDRAGRPFVGPTGQLLDDALARVGADRASMYVTNTVKHFKFEPRGQRRIHSKPNSREIAACLPWLTAEIESVRPHFLLCLGATAAQALLGRHFRMGQHRGIVYTDAPHAPWLMATIHPSAILRIPDAAARDQAFDQFVADLSTFKAAMGA